jgi:hypothetical protein
MRKRAGHFSDSDETEDADLTTIVIEMGHRRGCYR